LAKIGEFISEKFESKKEKGESIKGKGKSLKRGKFEKGKV